MPLRGPLRLRFPVNSLVRAASWFVPGSSRTEWCAKWKGRLENAWILHERGELSRRELALAAWLCLRSAGDGSRYTRISPGAVLGLALAALALIGILSRGFANTRSLFQPLPVEDTGRLVNIRYTGSVGQPAGVPPRLLPLWSSKSSLLASLAGFAHRPYAPSARVTWNFFSVLGTKPVQGRLFRPDDRSATVLSGAAWRSIFGGDPHVLGKRIWMEGRYYSVVGVLPDSFWAVSPRIVVWTPLVLEPEPDQNLPVLMGAVGRLKPGASPEALRSDLFRTAVAAHQRLPRPPEVIPFAAIPAQRLYGYLWGIGFAVLVGGVMVLKQQGIQFHYGWRYWRFLISKVVLLTAVPALAWIESTLTGLAFAIPFVVACALAFWWSFADQRRRCPECLERLAMPVTMGSWSSVLEPVSTEFLCQSGHGTLCVPETEQSEPDRWTAMDASWRELFEKVTPERH